LKKEIFVPMDEEAKEWRTICREELRFPISRITHWSDQTGDDKMGFEVYYA
jgi:hypothetical protein